MQQSLRWALIAAALSLSSCNIVEIRSEAESVASDHFEARRTDAFEDVAASYGKAMYAEVSASEWRAMLEKATFKLGRPRGSELESWNVFWGDQGAGTGTYTTLDYAVTYEHASGRERLVLFARAKESPRIVGHHFESSAFLGD